MSVRSAVGPVLIAGVLVAAAPSVSNEVELYEPCDNPDGLPVVTVDQGVTVDVDTPIGTGVPFVTTLKIQTVDGGDYLVDLVGEEVGTRKTVDVALSWTNGAFDNLTDYDMIVDDQVYQAVTNPEVASVSSGHCQVISVDEIYAYTGTPADSLTLDLSVSPFNF